MQRIYEVMFIVRPDLTDEEVDKLISTIESNATATGATVKNSERMGKRRLAYMVRGFNDGNYILLTLAADGKAIHEVERRLRVSEPVIKFITVRIDESQKRVDKIQKLRATKIKRSAQPVAAAEPAAVAVPEPVAAAAPAPPAV